MRKRFKLLKKQYKIKHRRNLRLAHRVRRHPAFFVPVLTFGVLLIAAFTGLVFLKKTDQTYNFTGDNARLVILSADDNERVIPTRANTVGELLKRLNITLNEGDVVEPAVATEIVSDNFKVNVYRALPVTIIEDGRETRALSAATTPRSIARQAGIVALPADEFKLDPVQNFVNEGVVGQRLVVDRATSVNVSLYGTPLAVRTQAETVGEFLKEKNIKLAEGETVQPALEAAISPAEPIFVNRKGVQVQLVEETIPADIQYVQDNSLSFGVTAVRQQGAAGKRIVTYQVNTETGGRSKLQEVVVAQPVTQIVARGSFSNIPADKQAVMRAAGIGGGEQTYVDFIVSRESRWNAGAANSRSGAYGLCQALPGSKMASAGGDWRTNPVTQLKWCNGYAKGRYGSWSAAYSFWTSHHYW